MDHSHLIAALGGTRAVAEILGANPRGTEKWAWRGIPPRYWLALAAGAQARGVSVTADDLAKSAPQAELQRIRRSTSQPTTGARHHGPSQDSERARRRQRTTEAEQ